MKVLLTGAAGFIGAHTALRLLQEGHEVIGLDNLSPYYDPQLKQDRLALLDPFPGFRFHELDVADTESLVAVTSEFSPDRFIHLAAQPGVRYSLENPMAYIDTNLKGFGNVLEACRHAGVPHLVYASSSSVYGNNARVPFSELDGVDHPLSLYAASKRANELMAHSYAHLYDLPVTGLRFFTVYGPWGRPDMAPIKFARAIVAGEPIPLFNNGDHRRDFTYIDDIVDGVVAVSVAAPPQATPDGGNRDDPASSSAPFRLYNIGNGKAVHLMDFVSLLQESLGRTAKLKMLPAQPGDVRETWADCSGLHADFGYSPETPLDQGVKAFVSWFRSYYEV